MHMLNPDNDLKVVAEYTGIESTLFLGELFV